MNRYTKLFAGMFIFCLLVTVIVYYWMYPEELPGGGFTIFTHPDDAV